MGEGFPKCGRGFIPRRFGRSKIGLIKVWEKILSTRKWTIRFGPDLIFVKACACNSLPI
jgi:hypothetical protein